MDNSHASLIRGLNIAAVVFSAITIVGSLIGILVMGLLGYAGNEFGPDAIRYSYEMHDNSIAGHMDELHLTEDDVMGMLNFGMLLGWGAVVWALVTGIVSLIAGIVGIRNGNVREKLGSVFGWGIAGGVAALLCGRIVTAVLFAISAVFAFKDKREPVSANGAYTQASYTNGTYTQASPYAQGAPVPPTGAYAQTYQPAAAPQAQTQAGYQQPSAYAQTYGYAPQPAAQSNEAAQVAQPAAQSNEAAQVAQPATQPAQAPAAAQPAAQPAEPVQEQAPAAQPASDEETNRS